MSPSIRNQAKLAGIALAATAVLTMAPDVAFAQSGHFNERTVECTDIGTQIQCTGKVSGLGGTTFEITISGNGIATVECTNPGGNVSPGQDTALTVEGTTGPTPTPRNGNYNFDITTDEPMVPNFPTCPNPGWTATVVDVTFTTVTLTLEEDGVTSDAITVPVEPEMM